MKKLYFIALLLTSISANIFPQSGWFELNHGFPSAFFNEVFFINENTGFVVGHETILKTTNAGLNWVNNFQFSDPDTVTFYSIDSASSNVLFAVGYKRYFNFGVSVIYRTTDGGNNWLHQYSSSNFSIKFHVRFANYYTGFIIHRDGLYNYTLLKTTNTGLNWELANLNTSGGIQFINSMVGYIIGGINYKTTNGGNNWFPIGGGGRKGWFVNENTGYQDVSPRIYRTTNSGSTWQMVFQSSDIYNVNDLFFTNINTGYIVTNNVSSRPVLMKTENAGASWYSQYDSINGGFNSITFINANTGYTVGNFTTAKILKTTNGGGPIGIQPISSEIPIKFNLHQNYPNPFNPISKIKFDIPKLSNVKVIIYDLLGREVTTLVNEQLKAGSYETDWDASGFASGIYFYSIITDEFTETRKMVLIK